jgi:hypothetical protein
MLELARYNVNVPPPPNKIELAHMIWWGAPGCTLGAVLEQIAGLNESQLTYAPPALLWTPRRMASMSSLSSTRTSSISAPRSGNLYIGEPTPSLPAGMRKTKQEEKEASGSSRVKKLKQEA